MGDPFWANIGAQGLETINTLARGALDIRDEAADPYTVVEEDGGKIIRFTAAAPTVNLPDGIPVNTIIHGIAIGGTVTVQASGTATVVGAGDIGVDGEFSALVDATDHWYVVTT